MYVLLLSSFHCVTEAPRERRPGAGRMSTRQKEKGAGGRVSAWGGCRVLQQGERECTLSKSCSVEVKE